MSPYELKTGRFTERLLFLKPSVKRIHNQADSETPIRLLQIVENLDNKAVEAWLYRVFRQAVVVYPNIEWTFFCVLPKSGQFDDDVRASGGRVIHSPCQISDKVSFLYHLRKVMREGRYDIVHSHHDIMSAFYLTASIGLPIRKRIVHLHNTSMSLPTPNWLKALLVREPMRQICLHAADQIVGISKDALHSMIGDRTPRGGRDVVVHYAVDTDTFRHTVSDPIQFRMSLGLSASAQILLFVGRIVTYKNPIFVLEILQHVAEINPNVVAVFAGVGDQASELRKKASKMGLESRVRLVGFREDVPRLMLNSNLLVWPSLEDPKEGLGLGIIEAQAAGLPILMSRSVPEEAIVVPQLVDVLPISIGSQAWADNAIRILNQPKPSRDRCLRQVEASSFSLESGVASLMGLYENSSIENVALLKELHSEAN
jgi:glycosyltransferase involved in cell wall biosynthesis